MPQHIDDFFLSFDLASDDGRLTCSKVSETVFYDIPLSRLKMMIGLILSYFESIPLYGQSQAKDLSNISVIDFSGNITCKLEYDDAKGWIYSTQISDCIKECPKDIQLLIVQTVHRELLGIEMMFSDDISAH